MNPDTNSNPFLDHAYRNLKLLFPFKVSILNQVLHRKLESAPCRIFCF